MRVLYFGTYSTGEGYPRNQVLIEGLRRAGAEVEECHVDFWRGAEHKMAGASGGFRRIRLLLGYAAAWVKLAVRTLRAGPHDVVVVGYTGQIDVFLARALSLLRGKPVVLDAFLSLHDTIVTDRGLLKEGSLAARLLRFLDRASCRAADRVLLDTDAHIRHFTRLTGLPASRFARVLVGEDDRAFPPAPDEPRPSDDPLRVLWFGTYVPLQGAGTVLDAAERLEGEPVRIRMVGKGQELPDHEARADRLANVDLVPRFVSYEELNREIRESHVCLGIFGTTPKALRVIPCKVYDALAVGRPVVTSDTPGSREFLSDGETAVLVPPGDGAALADAIRKLAANDGRRRAVGEAGHRLYREKASPEALGRRLLAVLSDVVPSAEQPLVEGDRPPDGGGGGEAPRRLAAGRAESLPERDVVRQAP